LREVKAPTLLRQTANRWLPGCQPYASAALYPQVSLFLKIPGEIKGGWEILRNKEFHNFYFSPNTGCGINQLTAAHFVGGHIIGN
jgi:hypothetical protein